jgi:tetratricopeptide (TPR) repeat protein
MELTEDAGLRAGAQAGVVIAHWWAGRFLEALPIAEQGLRQTREEPMLGSEIRGFSPHIFLLWIRAAMLIGTGELAEGEASLDRAVELAREYDEVENLVWALGVLPLLAAIKGRANGTPEHARRAVEIAEETGSTFSRVSAYMSLGNAHLLTGEWSEAAAASERALDIARETRAGLLAEASVLANLARAYLGLGNHHRARAAADEAVSVGRRRGTRSFERNAHLVRARVLLEAEGAAAREEVEAALGEALILIGETGEKASIPLIHEERARLAHLAGDDATRLGELREAHRLYTEMGATGHAERLAKELER